MKANPQIKLYKYDNSAFILIAVIDDYQQISFEHSLYSAGTFTVTINYNVPNARLFRRGLFVQFGNNPHDFGEILTMRNSIGSDGKGSEILNVTGYDARYLFKRRIIRNLNANDVWAMTAKGEICLRSLVRSECGDGAESKRRLPISNVIPETASAKGGVYSVSESYTNLYDALCTIATQSEIGWAVTFENGALALEVFEGRDLKDSVFFSTDFESLANGEYTDTAESFANVLYIGGKGEGSEQDMYEGAVTDEGGNEPTVLDRFEAYDSQASMTTEEEYEAEAGAMLSQYSQNVTVSGAGLVKCPFVFRENYDVGDVITLRFSDKTAVTQILSVTEQWSKGSYTLSFSFGKPQNNLAQQISLLLKKISNASKKTKAIECVKWYTIPTDTAQSEADVTFDTLGFTGAMTANKTFTFYLDNEKTGAKSYNIYAKNLSGNYTLTLTTGVSGATNFTIKGGSNIVARILVDENGNIVSQSMTATDLIESGNNQPATSDAVAQLIQGVGTTKFIARSYTNIANNTEYEFADIGAVADGMTAIVSISTASTGNVCHSLWLISAGNGNDSCGITLLAKSGYGNQNQTQLKVNWNAGGNCSLVLKLVSNNPSWSANNQDGYISILALNGRPTLKEKTTNLTSRSYSKSLITDANNENRIITESLIDGTITNSRKAQILGNVVNHGGTIGYYKITGFMSGTFQENVFLLQSREGELLIISVGYLDDGASAAPKIKRLINVYSKIIGFTYSGTDVYMQVAAYAHQCLFSQLAGNSIASLSITSATQAQYNAGTAITIET